MNHQPHDRNGPPAGSSRQPNEVSACQLFDENAFAPLPSAREDYQHDVARGLARMRERRIVIAGLARDVAWVLPLTMARIEHQGEYYQDYRVVIYENDSADETRWLLQAWASRNPRVQFYSETRDDPVNEASRCLSRAARMAYYRQQCHHVISEQFPNFDDVMLVDTDLIGGWSFDGVAHTYAQTHWDFVGANGIIYRRRGLRPNQLAQYDAWAFRNTPDFRPLTTKEVNRMLYQRGQPLQFVYSCFGGVGIYRMEAYLAGRYEGTDVEHVTFHQELHRQGYAKTYLNPNLIAVYGRKRRTMDPYAAWFLRCVDAIPGRSPTVWCYGNPLIELDAAAPMTQSSRRAA